MNKWQKVINQIAKDDWCVMSENYRKRRILLRESIKQYSYTFEKLVDYKNWNRQENVMISSFIKSINGKVER